MENMKQQSVNKTVKNVDVDIYGNNDDAIDESDMILDLDDENFTNDIEMDEAFISAEKIHREDQKNRLMAAKKIQSIQRGRKARKFTSNKKQAIEAEEQKRKEDIAATRIQAIQRPRSTIQDGVRGGAPAGRGAEPRETFWAFFAPNLMIFEQNES